MPHRRAPAKPSPASPGVVLHVGCGRAPLPPELAERGWREIRCDIDPAVEPDLVGSITAMDRIALPDVQSLAERIASGELDAPPTTPPPGAPGWPTAPASVEIVCSFDAENGDEVTDRFGALADRWVPCHGWSDERLAGQIRDDRIDILVDLAGHTDRNRLPVFARRPTPLQLTYLGYLAGDRPALRGPGRPHLQLPQPGHQAQQPPVRVLGGDPAGGAGVAAVAAEREPRPAGTRERLEQAFAALGVGRERLRGRPGCGSG